MYCGLVEVGQLNYLTVEPSGRSRRPVRFVARTSFAEVMANFKEVDEHSVYHPDAHPSARYYLALPARLYSEILLHLSVRPLSLPRLRPPFHNVRGISSAY